MTKKDKKRQKRQKKDKKNYRKKTKKKKPVNHLCQVASPGGRSVSTVNQINLLTDATVKFVFLITALSIMDLSLVSK